MQLQFHRSFVCKKSNKKCSTYHVLFFPCLLEKTQWKHKCLGNPLAAATHAILFQPPRKVLCVKVTFLIFKSSISHLLCLSKGSHTPQLLHFSASGVSGSNNPVTNSAVTPSSSNISMTQRQNEQDSSA